MSESLRIFGTDYANVTGIKANTPGGQTIIHTAGGGGGSSEWELVASKEVEVSTTSTSAIRIEEWDTEETSIWTSEKAVFVRIRDKAGKRNGYFYGSDTFIANTYAKDGGGSSSSYAMRTIYRVTSTGVYATYTPATTTGYGVYVLSVDDTGLVILMSRYSSSYSLTIDGTYTVEVYLLSPPTGKPFFT